jgi:2-dehydro-3-deoxygluconokinase
MVFPIGPTNGALTLREPAGSRWSLVALGEVMLRLDPGDMRIATTRAFRVWEGGGEYNVARGLRRCFGLPTTVVTALVDNPVGQLLQDLIFQGGVDSSHVQWLPFDGIGKTARNGLNFTERGFGVRAALGCSDRAHTAVSQLRAGAIDWARIFEREGARWFHTGGIFAALSDGTPAVAIEAMQAAHEAGAVVSYDLNYRPSLWNALGSDRAAHLNRTLVEQVDVLFGNEEDFTAALGYQVEGLDDNLMHFDVEGFRRLFERVQTAYPRLKVIATTLRRASSASRNDWAGLLWTGGHLYQSVVRRDLEIYDRVGGGDSFASGVIYGLITGRDPQWAVDCGAAHGALAMATPGDTSMVSLADVLKTMSGASVRVAR